MPRLSDITSDQRFVGLFIGESGSGKTCAECSFPSPIEVLDFDGRIRGAWNKPWIPMDGISYTAFPPRKFGMITELNNKLESYETLASVGQPIPKTLILDSLTSECWAMVVQAIGLTHSNEKGSEKRGKYLGVTPMPGPEDYGFEATTTYSILSYLRSLPIQNIIVSAHIVPVWGKEDPTNPFSNTIQIGEKLSVRDKIGANIGIYFDHVFRFIKREVNDEERFYVKFRGDLERTAFDSLPNGETEITKKNFYNEILLPRIGEIKNEVLLSV